VFRVELDFLQVLFVNSGPFVNIWVCDLNLPIEPSWSLDRIVEDVSSVGGSKDDNCLVCGESIHFYEELIQGVITLVVTTSLAH